MNIAEYYYALPEWQRADVRREMRGILHTHDKAASRKRLVAAREALNGKECYYCRMPFVAGQQLNMSGIGLAVHSECEWDAREARVNSPG
jgi:hypothetical protein